MVAMIRFLFWNFEFANRLSHLGKIHIIQNIAQNKTHFVQVQFNQACPLSDFRNGIFYLA